MRWNGSKGIGRLLKDLPGKAPAPLIHTMNKIDLDKPLYRPAYRVESFDGGELLLDTDRAHWIAVNSLGRSTLDSCRGKTLQQLNKSKNGQGLRRFLKSIAARDFLSNQPYDIPIYRGRADSLQLDRLHEFWITPNYDCNLRCKHCYTIEQVMHNKHVVELSSLLALIDEAKALGTEVFYLTGGEVMRYPHIFEVVEHIAHDRKLILFSNGMYFDDEAGRRLGRLRDRLIVQVSIEGHDEAHNRLIRGNRAFAPAMDGLRQMLRNRVRVGVSSTPCKATAQSIPKLTTLLCEIDENGARVEYHHLIMLLHTGAVKKFDKLTKLTHTEYSAVYQACNAAAAEGKKLFDSTLKIANEKIAHACASHGPKKDLCGAGYTILGVDAEGNLKTCAATINDDRFSLGKLFDEQGRYDAGRLEQLWRFGEKTQWVRNFSIARRPGERADDLRYFHGGGCWYNMDDPEAALSHSHPFYPALEAATLDAIRIQAQRHKSNGNQQQPQLLAYMHRHRIACAGSRKTVDNSNDGLDTGYCICFA